jgi:hypothetical protein
MKSWRSKKIAHIYCLARDLGMDNDLLHTAVASLTGKDSIRLLDNNELKFTISKLTELKHRQKQYNYRINSKAKKSGVIFLPTVEQKQLVDDYKAKLQSKLKLYSPDSFVNAICNRTLHKEYSKLNRDEMKKLIEILKSIYERRNYEQRSSIEN